MGDNRKKILESSIRVFSEKGVHQASLADIASAAGISKGTLFYYYRSKNDLLYDILDISIEEITGLVTKVIQNHEGEITGEITRELLVITFNNLLKYDFLMKINYYLVQEALLGNESFREKFKKKYRHWREDITGVLEKSKIPMDPARLGAKSTILLSALDGLCLQYLLDPGALDIDSICAELVELLKL